MAEPIIFTLLLGNKDQILEKINDQGAQNKLPIIPLQVNKESHISDKERIFAEILEKSHKEGKIPIFNIQLNNNNVKPIFQVQDLINSQNLNIKTTITFDQYSSLTQNPELEAYWKQIMEKVDHVFFTNEADQNLAINENIINKDKTTALNDANIDLASVFNNLIYNREIDQLLSGTIPDKAKLDKIIKTAKNQGGRVIIETWPISTEEATNLITAKFGITSEDQIYGLKLEINEILKDQNNAAENLTKYVSQISKQFQKDLGKSEINPIDFNFNTEKVMKDRPKDIQAEQTTPYEPPKENQPKPPGFFRRAFNYMVTSFKGFKEALFGKKEEPQAKGSTTPIVQQVQPESKPTIVQEQQATVVPITQPQQQTSANLPKQVSENSPVISSSQKQQDTPFDMTKQDYKAMMSASTSFHSANPSNDFNINDFKEELSQEDINKIQDPHYWYNQNDIINILTAALDDKKSTQPPISLQNTIIAKEKLKDLTLTPDEKHKALAEIREIKEMLKGDPSALKDVEEREKIINLSDTERKERINELHRAVEAEQEINTAVLNRAYKDIKENGKECGVIQVEMGTGHWCGLFTTYNKADDQIIMTFNDSFGNPIGRILPDTINKAFENNKIPPLIIYEQTKQQTNNWDCGPFSVENNIRKANGQPILTESEAKDKGPELRAKHAQIVIDKQRARKEAMSQGKANVQQSSNKFQKIVSSQKINDKPRSL